MRTISVSRSQTYQPIYSSDSYGDNLKVLLNFKTIHWKNNNSFINTYMKNDRKRESVKSNKYCSSYIQPRAPTRISSRRLQLLSNNKKIKANAKTLAFLP